MNNKMISWEEAQAMSNMAAYILTLSYFKEYGVEPDAAMVITDARKWFKSYCEANGIEEVTVEDCDTPAF